MVRRWLLRSVVGLACLGMAACNGWTPGGSAPGNGGKPADKAVPPEQLGNALFKAEPAEKLAAYTEMGDVITIPNAVIRLDKKQTIPAQVDAYLEVIGTPLPPGTKFDPADRDIVFDSRDTTRSTPYRRLREGDRVVVGQQVALFNDLDVLVQIESSQRMIKASDEAIAAAKRASDAVEKQLKQMESVGAAASKAELLNAQATLARYQQNQVDAERERVRAEGEEKRGWALHTKHRARSQVNGIITKVMRSPGEFLKAGDPIMEVLATDEQQVEGNLDAKDAWAVTPGMRVMVEPATPVGPDLRFGSVDHRLEVTGVVVTAHAGRPQVVSASLDGTVGVWDLFPPADRPRAQYRLQNGAPARSVACTGPKTPGGKHLIATGGDDGRVRVWDASNPEKLAEKPAEATDPHASAVAALAFSPDGRYLATAAGRDVWVWDAADPKKPTKLFALPGEHKDAVTAVRFTPQATLVTVCRDRAIRVWDVREKGAALARTIDHRKGNVDVLGLSREGGRILFDQDDARIDVVSLADGRPVGSIQNAAASARFAGLAIFSTDDALVLTASAGGDAQGELQLWRAPQPGGRASEWRRLVTPGRATPTCAAFSPDEANSFVVVGTQAGRVHVWTRRSNEEMGKAVRAGKVTSVLRLDPKTVKVRVETEAQPGEAADLLQDKGSATIIIRPADPMAAPKAAAPGVAPGGVVQAGGFGGELNPLAPAVGVGPAGGVSTAVTPQTGPMATPRVNPMTGTLPYRLPGSVPSPAPPPRPADQK